LSAKIIAVYHAPLIAIVKAERSALIACAEKEIAPKMPIVAEVKSVSITLAPAVSMITRVPLVIAA
jgi:hypothetical protein